MYDTHAVPPLEAGLGEVRRAAALCSGLCAAIASIAPPDFRTSRSVYHRVILSSRISPRNACFATKGRNERTPSLRYTACGHGPYSCMYTTPCHLRALSSRIITHYPTNHVHVCVPVDPCPVTGIKFDSEATREPTSLDEHGNLQPDSNPPLNTACSADKECLVHARDRSQIGMSDLRTHESGSSPPF